jgi:cyclopropane fatty-acyl-phospholipid synthase-like methyltransferase
LNIMSNTDPYADWKGWNPADFGRFSDFDDRYFQWHLHRAMPNANSPMKVLELGFGNGRFMGWLKQRGHQVTGIETNARLVEVATQAGFAATLDLAKLDAAAEFDLVAAFDVMEHVPTAELQTVVAALAARLLPQGRLLLRFPNGESPFGLWMQHGDLTHVQALGLSKLHQLCAACGLRLEHSGEGLPWTEQAAKRRVGAWASQRARRIFEWALRKMYSLPRGLDLSPNQLVVLSRV